MKIVSSRDIGRAVRRKRKQLGLTQAQLAQQFGSDQGWISRVENGKDTVGLGAALRLMNSLGLTLSVDDQDAESQSKPASATQSLVPAPAVDLADLIQKHKKL